MIWYNIHWNKTAFPGHLLEAQEGTISELNSGFRCTRRICCVIGFELVCYPELQNIS